MARIRWTLQALDDLDAICKFIARDAPRYSQIFAQRVFSTIDHLKDYPLLGRILPEIGNEKIREILLGNYRIIYRNRKNLVEILTIHHGARLLDISSLPKDNT